MKSAYRVSGISVLSLWMFEAKLNVGRGTCLIVWCVLSSDGWIRVYAEVAVKWNIVIIVLSVLPVAALCSKHCRTLIKIAQTFCNIVFCDQGFK